MSFLPSANKSALLAGILLTNFITGPLTIIWHVSPLPLLMRSRLMSTVGPGEYRRHYQASFCHVHAQRLVRDG